MQKKSISEYLSEVSPGTLHFGGARMAMLEIEAGYWSIRRQIEALIGTRLTNSVLQQAGANGGASFARSMGSAASAAEQRQLFESCLLAYQAGGFGQFDIETAEWPIGKVVVRGRDAFEAWSAKRHEHTVEEAICAYTSGVLVGFVNVISDRQDVVCVERECMSMGAEACVFELLPADQAREQAVVAFTPDPSLGRRINLLEMLFDRMPMGIAVINRDYKIVRVNPTWAAFIEQYTPSEAWQVVPGAFLFDLEPGTEDVLIPLFERVFTGETVRQDAVHLESKGRESFWDIVLAPLFEGDRVAALLNVSIDATERVQINRTLEQRVEERTQEAKRRQEIAESLRDIIRMINSNLPLDTFLDRAVQLAAERMDAAACALHRFDVSNRIISQLTNYGMPDAFPKGDARRFEDLKLLGGIDYLAASFQRKPTYTNYPPLPQRVAEIERDASLPEAIKQKRIALRERFAASLSVPLFIQEEIYGGMVFYYTEPQKFSDEQVQLALTFAEQVALAIENAQLSQQVRRSAVQAERSRLARDLHDAVTQTLFSASLIAEVLPKLWERDAQMGREKLEELRALTRGALSEMRTLVLELRPGMLVEVDLGDLMRHLANAFTGRTRLPANLTVNGSSDPPLGVKETFYRVAQEALNNVAKHADASQVSIHLERSEFEAQLIVQDDGRGFDMSATTAENLGLRIMRERAEGAGARLNIQSDPREGTRIELFWRQEQE
jgi:signal transduction histidine kinase/predicted hydrocarbon binding protein